MILQLLDGTIIILPVDTIEQAKKWFITENTFANEDYLHFVKVESEDENNENNENNEKYFVMFLPPTIHLVLQKDSTIITRHCQWLSTCTNESILCYFIKNINFLEYPMLWANPHPIIVEHLFTYLEYRFSMFRSFLSQNSNDQIVTYLLQRPLMIDRLNAENNTNFRMMMWCSKIIKEDEYYIRYLCNLFKKVDTVQTIEWIWEEMRKRNKLFMLPKNNHPVVNKLRIRDFYEHHLWKSVKYSTHPELNRMFLREFEECNENDKEVHFDFTNPSDLIVDYILLHIHHYHHKNFCKNTNDRAIDHILSHINQFGGSNIVAEYFMTNPNYKAVEYVKKYIMNDHRDIESILFSMTLRDSVYKNTGMIIAEMSVPLLEWFVTTYGEIIKKKYDWPIAILEGFSKTSKEIIIE